MDWIQQWQSKLNKQNGVAPLVRTGGSRHTGLAALPYRNIHENRLGGQISRFRHLFQYPRKDLVHGFCGKPMTEIITHRGKMRRFLLKRISKKPTAADICADLIRCSPQGRHAVQMLNQHHFEQHNRVHTVPLYALYIV